MVGSAARTGAATRATKLGVGVSKLGRTENVCRFSDGAVRWPSYI